MIETGADIPREMAHIVNAYRAEGRSWTWISRKFGLSPETLKNISTQKHSPTLDTAVRFWAALGMKLTVTAK